MKRDVVWVWAVALLAVVRQVDGQPPFLLDPMLQNYTALENRTFQVRAGAANLALASGADARSSANEVAARLNSEAAGEVAKKAQASASIASVKSSQLRGAMTDAFISASRAANAADDATSTYQSAQSAIVQAEVDAPRFIGHILEDRLAPIFKGFQEWKLKVNYDPAREAAVEGVKAARPYERALVTVETRAAEYEQRASGLSTQARALRTEASKMANEAVALQASGDVNSAQQDMMRAHTLMSQAASFDAQAQRLMDTARTWNGKIPDYAGAAEKAHYTAMHRAFPDSFSGPPADFSLPPSLNVR